MTDSRRPSSLMKRIRDLVYGKRDLASNANFQDTTASALRNMGTLSLFGAVRPETFQPPEDAEPYVPGAGDDIPWELRD